jgi:hypothetical protein
MAWSNDRIFLGSQTASRPESPSGLALQDKHRGRNLDREYGESDICVYKSLFHVTIQITITVIHQISRLRVLTRVVLCDREQMWIEQ